MRRVRTSLRTFLWICAMSLAAVMASERLYWYWSGIDADSVGVLTSFYAVAVGAAVWALARVPGGGLRRAVPAGMAFALVVEGIITPVVYEDGPLPVLFLMFVGWHGLLAFVGFVYLIRWWALHGSTQIIAVAAATTGVWWGVWALVGAVTDRETAEQFALDGGSADVLTPSQFAVYAGWVGVAMVVAHLVMDMTWPQFGWRPSRAGSVTIAVSIGALGLLLVVSVVPWAPLKFTALAWMVRWMFRREAKPVGAPTLIDELGGRIRKRSLIGLVLLPVCAWATYTMMWALRDQDALGFVYWSLIAVQIAAGVGAVVWLLRAEADRWPPTIELAAGPLDKIGWP